MLTYKQPNPKRDPIPSVRKSSIMCIVYYEIYDKKKLYCLYPCEIWHHQLMKVKLIEINSMCNLVLFVHKTRLALMFINSLLEDFLLFASSQQFWC